jgi:hypothetical protein
MIFLNLFIAIVVDTYMIRKEANSVAVKNLDLEVFIECWSLYDPYAEGEILLDDLDSLIKDLS